MLKNVDGKEQLRNQKMRTMSNEKNPCSADFANGRGIIYSKRQKKLKNNGSNGDLLASQVGFEER